MKFPELVRLQDKFIMNEDDILQATKSVIQALDTLKKEYVNVLHSSEVLLSNKNDSFHKYLDSIDLGNDVFLD